MHDRSASCAQEHMPASYPQRVDRTAALLAAIRGGLLKSLVIDEAGAVALLSAARVASETLPAKRKKGKGR